MRRIVSPTTIMIAISWAGALMAADAPLRIGQPPLPVQARLKEYCGDKVVFSPNGRLLMTDDNVDAQIWDAIGFKPIGDPIHGGSSIDAIRFAADGSMAFISSSPNRNSLTVLARYFDSSTAAALKPEFNLGKDACFAVSSGDGKYIAESWNRRLGGDWATELQVLDRATSHIVFSRNLAHVADKIRLSEDGSYLAYEEEIYPRHLATHVIRLRDGKLLFENALQIRDLDYAVVDFSPDGKSVAIGDEKGFKVFDLATERITVDTPAFGPAAERGDCTWFRSVKFSRDGAFILAWRRTALHRWDIAAGGGSLPVFQAAGLPENCSISRDCRRMSYWFPPEGQRGGEIQQGFAVTDVDSGKRIWQWVRPDEGATALAGDGRHLAVSDPETRSVYLLDLNDLPPAAK